MIFQALIILTTSLLCLSQECLSVTIKKKSILELYYLIPVKIFLSTILLPLQAITPYSHLVPPLQLRFIVIWKMNDVVVRDGLELLMLMCQTTNPVLVTSNSFQAPYRPVEVHPLQDVQVPTSLLME